MLKNGKIIKVYSKMEKDDVYARIGEFVGMDEDFIYIEGMVGEQMGKLIAIPRDKVVEVVQ